MSDSNFRPNFNIPDWGQTGSKTRIQDQDNKENRQPLDNPFADPKDENEGIAANSGSTPGRKESVATKLGWSTTFTMDEDKRSSLVSEALRRQSVAVAQRKESMAIEAAIEAQRKKSAIFVSPKTNSASGKSGGLEFRSGSLVEPGSPMDDGFSTQALRSKSDSDDPLFPGKDMKDLEQRSMSIAGPDFGVRREPATFGRRPSQVDHIRRDSMCQDRRPSYADTLFERGRLPGILDEEEVPRGPGDRDAAGNKIHRRGVFSRILHWEMEAANAEDKHERRKPRFSGSSGDSHSRKSSGYSDAGHKEERRESGYSSAGGRHERKISEYERTK